MIEEKDFSKSYCQELKSRLTTNSTNSYRPPSTGLLFVEQQSESPPQEATLLPMNVCNRAGLMRPFNMKGKPNEPVMDTLVYDFVIGRLQELLEALSG